MTCPNASTCAWAPNADDARWVTCEVPTCGITRLDPAVQVREATESAVRNQAALGSAVRTNGAQSAGNGGNA